MEYKYIEGFPDYRIYKDGRVYSEKTNRFLKQHIIRSYYYVSLTKNHVTKTCRVHRLVAKAFIPNPENLPEVNHKDENKLNNHVDNLEWCTNYYNQNYGTHQLRVAISNGKPVLKIKDGVVLDEYYSASEAARQNGLDQGNITRVC